jgi:hypothetical protein
LDFPGPVFDRTLTFTSESDRIEIGRSSQRASKDLSPRPNNALFDSRVMSRVHAILRVSLNEKVGSEVPFQYETPLLTDCGTIRSFTSVILDPCMVLG